MRLVLLEDERDIAEAIRDLLLRDHHHVRWCATVQEAEGINPVLEVDAAVLDVMIENDDDAGFTLATAWRAAGYRGPILFTTARDTVEDRVRGLDLGGDDYLVKPYSLAELQARVRALMRRDSPVKQALIEHGKLRMDTVSRRTWWGKREMALSAREFALLECLALNPEATFRAVELADRIFPEATSGGLVVRVYVRQLRQKIHPSIVATASGGYRLGVQ
jgi:DNA-binding response OmpR family regulator